MERVAYEWLLDLGLQHVAEPDWLAALYPSWLGEEEDDTPILALGLYRMTTTGHGVPLPVLAHSHLYQTTLDPYSGEEVLKLALDAAVIAARTSVAAPSELFSKLKWVVPPPGSYTQNRSAR